MRKMKLVVLSALLCMSMGLTAQAAGESSSNTSAGTKVVTAEEGTTFVKENCETIAADAVTVKIAPSTEAMKDEDTVKAALQVENTENVKEYMFDVSLDADGVKVQPKDGGVYVSIPGVPVNAGDKVAVFHLANGAWERIANVKVENGVIVAGPFKSFSPIYVVTAPAAADNGSNGGSSNNGSSNSGSSNSGSSNSGSSNSGSSSNGSSSSGSSSGSSSSTSSTTKTTSPKTADSFMMIYAAAAVAVLALAGVEVCRRKARA